MSRIRVTTRRLMLAVLIAALALAAYRALMALSELFHDDPYHAIKTMSASWHAGPEPSVTADLFEGGIQVFPSADGTVKAEVTFVAVTKNSQADADGALETIDLMMDHRGDSVRIVARGASGAGIRKDANLVLYVPPGVRLDLRTGRGEIRVGRDYKGNAPIHRPVAAHSIRARNDSAYRLGYAQGSITVETLAPSLPAGAAPIPCRLQLDAPGHIEVIADSAVVEARAWHGKPPDSWGPGVYETEDEGAITFEGSLAGGEHTLRAAHRITMRLSAPTALRVDAEAIGGKITGDLLPEAIEQRDGRSKWISPVGTDAHSHLLLRTDDGSMVLDRKP
jgi:hypothetical protein